MPTMGFLQSQSMKQQLKLSPQMLMSASFMELSIDDLSDRLYKEVEKNPALEIFSHGSIEPRSVQLTESYGNSSLSDEYQSMLENTPTNDKTLQSYLEEQLSLLPLNENLFRIGYNIIHNLDDKGYNREDPQTLLHSDDSLVDLHKMLSIVHHLDPVGCACKNIAESLWVQSLIKKEEDDSLLIPRLLSPLLKDNFSIFEKQTQVSAKNYIKFIKKSLEDNGVSCTLDEVEIAIEFIKKLNPYPAAPFSRSYAPSSLYAIPDIFVHRRLDKENEDKTQFEIEFRRGNLPDIRISSMYEKLVEDENKDTKNFAKEAVLKAQSVINALNKRSEAIHSVVTSLVLYQSEFFDKGPGYLKPLRMLDIANYCNLDESTVSRISNKKYIQCEWGVVEIKSLFSTAIKTTSLHSKKSGDISQASVLQKIKVLIENHEKSGSNKKLSDQKIADALEVQGIKIARRTVAKYRQKLSIESSYER